MMKLSVQNGILFVLAAVVVIIKFKEGRSPVDFIHLKKKDVVEAKISKEHTYSAEPEKVHLREGILELERLPGVILSSAKSNFPSFDVEDLEGTLLPYAKIQCGDSLLKPGHKIPNIIHYVWFGQFNINLVQYYAIRSAALIQKPHAILFHMDHTEPVGPYWNRLKDEVPCIRIVNAIAPSRVFERKISLVEHKSDVVRLNILLQYGGIYSDVNVIFVRPMDELMSYSTVLGKEEDRSYGNSFILSERNASFVQVWLKSYVNFDHTHWSDHSTVMPLKLHREFPDLPLHVELYSMMRPNYMDGTDWLTHKNWDLRHNYCVHIYVNQPNEKAAFAPILQLPESQLVTLDNTFGQLIRISLFGTPYFKMDLLDEKLMKLHSTIECGAKELEKESRTIPNILHYVWSGERIRFQNYLAVRSAVQILQPSVVYFHKLSKSDPFYYSYLEILREVKCLEIVEHEEMITSPENPNEIPEIMNLFPKLQILHKYGGIVLDINSTILKPFDDLLSIDLVIGTNNNRLDNNTILMAKPKSDIISEWLKRLNEPTPQYSDKLISVIRNSTTQNILFDEHLTYVPNSSWFSVNDPEIPPSRVISFEKCELDMDEIDINEKTALQQDNFLGIIGREILLGKFQDPK